MSGDDPIRRVTVVGTGLVGTAWAAQFLSRGLEVTATDPAPGAETRMRETLARIWPIVADLAGLPPALPTGLRFQADLAEALRGAEFVQESGPEREDFKIKLFAELDGLLPPEAIIATSTSGLLMSRIQSACRHPERCVVGHPFNPPYLVPLVEVVGGQKTAPETVDRAYRFYVQVGMKPIRLRKEVTGHVANRLQAAVFHEAVYLAAEGVASVADIDTAMAWALGLRYAVMGPCLTFHLAGGQGGMQRFFDNLGGPVQSWWADLGRPDLTPEVRAVILKGVEEEAAGRSISELEKERNEFLLKLRKIKG